MPTLATCCVLFGFELKAILARLNASGKFCLMLSGSLQMLLALELGQRSVAAMPEARKSKVALPRAHPSQDAFGLPSRLHVTNKYNCSLLREVPPLDSHLCASSLLPAGACGNNSLSPPPLSERARCLLMSGNNELKYLTTNLEAISPAGCS
eukprot:5069192-Amphidinium_carterae.1